MNIGIVTTWYERGAAYVSKAYMNALQTQGHVVHIFVRGGASYAFGDPAWHLPNVTWGSRYAPPRRLTRCKRQYVNMMALENWLYRNNIDLVIFNEEHGIETVKTVRELGYSVGAYIDYYRQDTVEQFREYDFLLCNTRRHYEVFRRFPNCLFIPWGTDIDLYAPSARNRDIDQSQQEVVFFHSAGWGGVNLRKGTDLVVEAFQYVAGHARLILHSQSPLENYGDTVATLVATDDRIDFIAKTVTAPGLYHMGDVFVYPTRLEGIGLCIPEALASGLPVITTKNGPMNEFVEDGLNGLLVSVRETRERHDGYYWPECVADVDHLARQMQRYVDDRALLAVHKKQARTSAERRLDWAKNSADLGDHLCAIVRSMDKNQRRPSPGQELAWRSEAMYVAALTQLRRIGKRLCQR